MWSELDWFAVTRHEKGCAMRTAFDGLIGAMGLLEEFRISQKNFVN
jgi:hypothetical protein